VKAEPANRDQPGTREEAMAGDAGDGKPTVQQKRRMYVAFFVIAFLVDLVFGLIQYGTYAPTLVGLAIMITAALFYVFSLIRGR
jgi:FtsH-binding integral membrane protein